MNDVGSVLREWAPLSDLFSRLPSRAKHGLFYQDVKVTCVDVLPEFLALGTNLGIVYWYDRKKKDLQRLRCENSSGSVTVVKIISTVEYMVACGNADGNVSIFQIPKVYPDTLPDSFKPKNKQVERYTVSDLHKSAITALEWSKNGMKLFSGDKTGAVVLTEIDFYMHLCKSAEILNEAYEVVQLSYHQHNLLISTTYRSIICKKLDKWEISQVGKKDRKILGNFGGIFYKKGLGISDVQLYSTRPGLRIWISDINGCVQQTLLFKDLLKKECWEVPIINPISESLRKLKPAKEATFGTLLPFNGDMLVTYGNDVVYILDPVEMSVLASVSSLRRVLSVATHKDEIFILEGERSLIRLSYKPENLTETNPSSTSPDPLTPLATSLRDITTKIQSANIISVIPPLLETSITSGLSIYSDNSGIANAEEAQESPVKLRRVPNSESDSSSPVEPHDAQKKFDIYSKIGEQDYDDSILFKHHKRKKKQSDMRRSTFSLSSSSSDERDNYIQPTLMNLSTVGVLPDLRSPDSILNDIEYKEKILADVLNFDKVKINLDLEEHKINVEQPAENDFGDMPKESCQVEEPLETKEDACSVDEKKDDQVEEEKEPVKEEHAQELSDTGEFCIKPFKHILPEFDKIKYDPIEDSSKVIPGFLTVPTQWKLNDIKLSHEIESSTSDTSLGDWEII